jgi:hypothetical protein
MSPFINKPITKTKKYARRAYFFNSESFWVTFLQKGNKVFGSTFFKKAESYTTGRPFYSFCGGACER